MVERCSHISFDSMLYSCPVAVTQFICETQQDYVSFPTEILTLLNRINLHFLNSSFIRFALFFNQNRCLLDKTVMRITFAKQLFNSLSVTQQVCILIKNILILFHLGNSFSCDVIRVLISAISWIQFNSLQELLEVATVPINKSFF